MTTQMTTEKTTEKPNGVDVPMLFETIDAIKDQPTLAKCQFRARNRWMDGAHCRTTIRDFHAAGEEDQSRTEPFEFDADEPPVLLGENRGANPVEFALTALAGCLTTSLIYHAAARGIRLNAVESQLEGDLDLRGFLNLDDSVRNGYENVRVTFKVDADAPREQIEELVKMAQQRSPVFDMMSNPVPVTVGLAD